MANDLFGAIYNPDVLSCLANLSNDEVFTPPEIVNQMLDMLPQELFSNPDTTFLDPACKTGVFLREIAKRLIKGLEPQIPDLQERIDHIFQKQLYGIAITELTSLLSRRGVYCSKYPNSEFSVTHFDDEHAQGNIRFKRIQHGWQKGKFVAKKYEPYYEDDRKAFYDSFLQEIKIMYKLNHRNVVRIYNYYAYEEQYTGYILMEYIIGETLPDYLKWIGFLGDFEKIDDIFVQLIDGFQYIESQGIVHRDIREGNIMVDENGVVKIIDFGLGKTFKPVDTSTDSKIEIINREGVDALPDEYFEGRYTSQTDMFYLAELFNRLLRKNGILEHFSYMPILQKMMAVSPKDRFPSFAAVQEAINAKDFSTLEISSEDKQIYQDFSNAIHQCISKFSEESEFNYSVEEFEKRLLNLLRVNCFEDYIQQNDQLIETVVSGPFHYRPSKTVRIKCNIVARFQKWFLSLTPDSKKLVLYNIISKLSDIPVEEPEPELPF